jgi:hypothetical protein
MEMRAGVRSERHEPRSIFLVPLIRAQTSKRGMRERSQELAMQLGFGAA